MAIRTKEELLSIISARIGDDKGDEAIGIMEDVSDTFDSLASTESVDWKRKYEENDNAWRERYKDRFLNGEDKKSTEDVKIKIESESQEKPMSFDDLFD